MAATTFARIEICACCLDFLANRETSGHDFHCPESSPAPLALWADSTNELIPDGASEGFSSFACEGCGEVLAGDRFLAYVAA